MALRTLKPFTYRSVRYARVLFLRLLEVNAQRSEHLIYHKNHQKHLINGVLKKGVTFYSWGQRLIRESLAPELQAV